MNFTRLSLELSLFFTRISLEFHWNFTGISLEFHFSSGALLTGALWVLPIFEKKKKEKQGKPPKKTRIFLYVEPLKIPGKEGKNAQKKKREIPCNEKSKEIQKSKERKICLALGPFCGSYILRVFSLVRSPVHLDIVGELTEM